MKNLLLLSCMLLQSCWPLFNPDKDGKFLKDVVPLTEFNSEYDDYNSDIAQNKVGDFFLTFSSKRDRKDKLNLVTFPATLTYDKKLRLEKFSKSLIYLEEYVPVSKMLPKVNGNFNVYGPNLISPNNDLISYGGGSDTLLLFYADDAEGDMQIKYVRRALKGISEPQTFDLLNSPQNDGYPTISFLGDKIYFCSDREGNFDIYELSIPRALSERVTLESLVNPKVYQLRKVEELSTSFDEKCPYLWGDLMVFVSDRPGGEGGQDIYYSRLENGKWSSPVNAGNRINSSHNEYRPILPRLNNFSYPLMIFSSDRPGGKGGFDLYMTGLTEL